MISQEAIQRFEASGLKYDESMKPLPDDMIGLGYEFIPVIVQSCDDKTLQEAQNYVKLSLPSKVPENDIFEQTFSSVVNIGCHPMGYHLGLNSRFIDPKEIQDAIEEFKNQEKYPHSYFLGFIHASRFVECNIDEKMFCFTQQNTISNGVGSKIRSNGFSVCPLTKPRISKFFNWVMTITIEKEE